MVIQFNSLVELLSYSEEEYHLHLESQRWGDDPGCIKCGCTDKVYRIQSRHIFKCGHCLHQFSATIGTIFEHSHIPLKKWFIAIFLNTSHKKGVSSCQLARDIQVTQRTAWGMLQKIRGTYEESSEPKAWGVVQIDESYIGGKAKNKHKDKKIQNTQGRNLQDKIAVFGILEMGGHVRAMMVTNVKQETLIPLIYNNIESGSIVMTDDWLGYGSMSHYDQRICNHSGGQYLNKDTGATTNAIESYWSHMKRTILGTYHSISRKYCNRYLNEISFRHNERFKSEYEKFNLVLKNSEGRYKTYKQLTA